MLPGGTIRSALKTRLGEAGGYAVAITAALLCALLRLLVDPLLGNEAGLLLFVPAILAAAMAGGAGPTFVAATLSIGSSLAIARFHLDGDAVVRIVVFILIALSVGWLGIADAAEWPRARTLCGRASRARSAAAINPGNHTRRFGHHR